MVYEAPMSVRDRLTWRFCKCCLGGQDDATFEWHDARHDPLLDPICDQCYEHRCACCGTPVPPDKWDAQTVVFPNETVTCCDWCVDDQRSEAADAWARRGVPTYSLATCGNCGLAVNSTDAGRHQGLCYPCAGYRRCRDCGRWTFHWDRCEACRTPDETVSRHPVEAVEVARARRIEEHPRLVAALARQARSRR